MTLFVLKGEYTRKVLGWVFVNWFKPNGSGYATTDHDKAVLLSSSLLCVIIVMRLVFYRGERV